MIRVDPTEAASPVRPLHGVSLGPIDRGWALDLSEHYRAVRIPSVRTHDAPIQMDDVVDLHCIFPNPKADPDDPANYVFGPTDDYLHAIHDVGAEIYFRFGETIEHQPTKRYVKADLWTPKTMATIAVNTARHYNEGWADGHEWDIRRWEFWCEPEMGYDRGPGEGGPVIWEGTAGQFYDCYRAVAMALKGHDAALQIGLAGFTTGFVMPWLEADPDDATAAGGFSGVLLSAIEEKVPVDFFSWHIYPDGWARILDTAARVRERLDVIGLDGAEQHLTEWAYNPKLVDADGEFTFMMARRSGSYERYEHAMRVGNGPAGAAFVFGTLASMQDSSIDLAHHYTGITQPFGMFEVSGRPQPKFTALEAFAGFLADDVSPVTVSIDPDRTADVAGLAAVMPDGALRLAVAHLNPALDGLSVMITGDDAGYRIVSARNVGDQWWEPAQVTTDGQVVRIDTRGPNLHVVDLATVTS